ncbi:MAG: iron-sulfur cluster assembly scaffold protein [Candidatus Lokiarchaeota archaeon]|nr:iron-sulfur cluster assembly scaffold protein [Candidatus Lokiarchaeota archaeon]
MNNRGSRQTKAPDEAFDEFAKELQQELIDEELREYNERIVELFHDPPNHGKLAGEGVIEHSYLGPCGDRMTFFLAIKDGTIEKANFITTGCGASVAAGAQATLLVEGKSIDEVLKIEASTIDDALGGLPADHKHCAELAVRTLRQALQKRASGRDGTPRDPTR